MPVRMGLSWLPGFHAQQVPVPFVHSANITAAKRSALDKLLGSSPAESRVDRSFAVGGIGPSRWTDGSFGAFYVAATATTTQFELLHHLRSHYSSKGFGSTIVTLQIVQVDVSGTFDDVRLEMASDPQLRADSYAATQALAKALRSAKSRGVVYESVRDPANLCAAVFDRAALTDPRIGGTVSYQWNGTDFV